MISQQLETSLRGLPIDNSSIGELIDLLNSVVTTDDYHLTLSPPDDDTSTFLTIGDTLQFRHFHQTIPLSTGGATTQTGLTPNGTVLSASLRVASAITGLDSADHHIELGISGTTDKYIDKANGSASTSIALNTKDAYYGGGSLGAEQNELILTVSGGSDNTPSAGSVEIEIIYTEVGLLI